MLIVKSFELLKEILSNIENDNHLKILGNLEEKPPAIDFTNNSESNDTILSIHLCIFSSSSSFIYSEEVPLKDKERLDSIKSFLDNLKIIKANIKSKNNNFELY